MEYPIHTSENSHYVRRGITHHHIGASPSVVGVQIGSALDQFRSSNHLDQSPSNQEMKLRQMRNLHQNKSPVKCDTSPPTPSGSSSSGDLPINYSGLNYNGMPPYCNQLNGGSNGSPSIYSLPQYLTGSEPYSSSPLYSGNFSAASQQMYSQYTAGFLPSSATLSENVNDIGTNVNSCRIDDRNSPPQMSFNSRSLTTPNRTEENNANTYDWMKIKRNPPKNSKNSSNFFIIKWLY